MVAGSVMRRFMASSRPAVEYRETARESATWRSGSARTDTGTTRTTAGERRTAEPFRCPVQYPQAATPAEKAFRKACLPRAWQWLRLPSPRRCQKWLPPRQPSVLETTPRTTSRLRGSALCRVSLHPRLSQRQHPANPVRRILCDTDMLAVFVFVHVELSGTNQVTDKPRTHVQFIGQFSGRHTLSAIHHECKIGRAHV